MSYAIAKTRLTYANVMATLAFFIAIGGTSYAAAKITGKEIKDGTVAMRDLAKPVRQELRVATALPESSTGVVTKYTPALTTLPTKGAATCPAGSLVVGGGATSSLGRTVLVESYPSHAANTWNVTAIPSGAETPLSITVYAVCLADVY